MIRLAFLLLMLALSGCSPDASLGFGAVLAIGYGFWWLFMAGTIVVGIVAAVLGKDGLVQSCWDVWEASDSGASDGIDLFLRMLLFFAPLLFLVLALPAQSQTITDGDSLRQAGKRPSWPRPALTAGPPADWQPPSCRPWQRARP
jgi:hypothetical protein